MPWPGKTSMAMPAKSSDPAEHVLEPSTEPANAARRDGASGTVEVVGGNPCQEERQGEQADHRQSGRGDADGRRGPSGRWSQLSHSARTRAMARCLTSSGSERAAWMAASAARALLRVSLASSSGTLSATMPAPAVTSKRPWRMTTVRMAMAKSRSVPRGHVADRTAVRAAWSELELPDDLHGTHLGCAGKRARGKGRPEHVPRAVVRPELPLHLAHDVHHVADSARPAWSRAPSPCRPSPPGPRRCAPDRSA